MEEHLDVLPYFQRMESSHGGNSEFRGKSGPLNITHGKRDNPLHNAFVKATEQACLFRCFYKRVM